MEKREVPGHGGSCCKGPEESEAGVFEEPEGGLGGTQGERAERCWALLGGRAWGFSTAVWAQSSDRSVSRASWEGKLSTFWTQMGKTQP